MVAARRSQRWAFQISRDLIVTFERWFTLLNKSASSAGNLFVFHYAGGNSNIYRNLVSRLRVNLDVFAVDLPGRARRFNEPLIGDLGQVADEAEKALRSHISHFDTKPLFLFGHSIGAKVAYEVAQRLAANTDRFPHHLIVSGSGAPHVARTRPPMHDLPQAAFIEELRRYGGTPEQLLADDELLDMLIPMLRSDFKLAETYKYKPWTPMACGITAFGGEADETVPLDAVQAWASHTSGQFEMKTFPSGHFFLHAEEASLAAALDETLESAIRRVTQATAGMGQA